MKVELVRGDIAQEMREYIAEHSKDMDRERRVREDQERTSVATTDELWLRFERRHGKVYATVVGGLPDGVTGISVEGRSEDDCVFDARWLFVERLKGAGVCRTYEAARERASKCHLVNDATLKRWCPEFPEGREPVSV